MSERIDSLRQLLETEPDDPFLHYSLAFEVAKTGDADAALDGYRRTLELDPDYHYAAFQSARVLQEEGRDEEAIAMLRAQIPRAEAAGDGKAAGELAGLLDEIEP